MSALKRRHDRECSYSRGGRLFLVGRTLCCQWRGCIVKRLREPEESNGPGGQRRQDRQDQQDPQTQGQGRAAPGVTQNGPGRIPRRAHVESV